MKVLSYVTIFFLLLSVSGFSQDHSSASQIKLRFGLSTSNYENNLRQVLSEYLMLETALPQKSAIESSFLPHFGIEVASESRKYFIQMRYQPLFNQFNFDTRMSTIQNGTSYNSAPTHFSIGFQNNSFSISCGKLFNPDSPINFGVIGGGSINTMRMIFRQDYTQMKSVVGIAPGFFAGGELKFGYEESPIHLRVYIQQHLGGAVQLEENLIEAEFPDLSETISIRTKTSELSFSWVELGLYVTFRLR